MGMGAASEILNTQITVLYHTVSIDFAFPIADIYMNTDVPEREAEEG